MATTQTIQYIKQHLDSTPEEIESVLAADLTTQTNLPTHLLSGYLTRTGIFGPFILYKAGALPEELGPFKASFAMLDYILDKLRGDKDHDGYIETSSPDIASQMNAIMAGFMQAGILTPEQKEGFITCGGGYKYSKLNSSEIKTLQEQLKTEKETEETLASLRAEEVNLTSQIEVGRQRVEQAMNAFRTALQEGRTDEVIPSFEELVMAFGGN